MSSARRRVAVFLTMLVTGILVIALALAGVIAFKQMGSAGSSGPGTGASADAVAAGSEHQVTQTNLSRYCPAQIGLSDTGKYGDSQYAANVGDLASSATFARFGDIYNPQTISLKNSDPKPIDDANGVLSLDSMKDSRLVQGEIVAPDGGSGLGAEGDGVGGAVASYASQGDLQGLAAMTCVDASSTSSYLLPGTQAGTSLELVVANPTDKSTTVQLTGWGSSTSGELDLLTSSTLTLGAGSEKTIDISAAMPSQDGVFVSIESDIVPVFSYVRMTKENGLTPLGVEYFSAMPAFAHTATLLGVGSGQDVQLQTFGHVGSQADVSWLTADGLKAAGNVEVHKDQVMISDLGNAPAGALGILISSDESFGAAAVATSQGDGEQYDISSLIPGVYPADSAIVVPSALTGSIVIANPADNDATVTLDGKEISLPAHTATSVPVAGSQSTAQSGLQSRPTTQVHILTTTPPAGSAAGLTSEAQGVEGDEGVKGIVWSFVAGVKKLTDSQVAGISVLQPTSLVPQTVEVSSVRSGFVIS